MVVETGEPRHSVDRRDKGRITVLEVVAMTSLGMLLKTGHKHAAQHVLSVVRREMRSKSKDIKLSPVDADAAIAYAQELIEATFENMKPNLMPDEQPTLI